MSTDERQRLVAWSPPANSRWVKAASLATALGCGGAILGARGRTARPTSTIVAEMASAPAFPATVKPAVAWTPETRCARYATFSETGCEMCGYAEPASYYDVAAAQSPLAAKACVSSSNLAPENPLPAAAPLPGSKSEGKPAGNAWYKACLWDALAHLPETCAGTFVPAPPAASPPATTTAEYTCDCEAHAYCFGDCGPGGGDNPYCAAFLAQHPAKDYFDWSADARLMGSPMGNVGPDAIWSEEEYWCDAATLKSIDEGTFEPQDRVFSAKDRAYLAGDDVYTAIDVAAAEEATLA